MGHAVNGPRVEELTDLAEANEVLAAAFWTDPMTRTLLGNDRRNLRTVYDLVVPLMLRNPGSILFGIRDEGGLASVAVCQGPGKEMPVLPMLIRGLPLAWRIGLRQVRTLMRFDKDMRKHSPLRKHQMRLAILGTRPDAFGRGYGAALLKRIDEHTLSQDLPNVYLEADRNGYPRRLYERHGYRVQKEFQSVAGAIVVMVKPLPTQ